MKVCRFKSCIFFWALSSFASFYISLDTRIHLHTHAYTCIHNITLVPFFSSGFIFPCLNGRRFLSPFSSSPSFPSSPPSPRFYPLLFSHSSSLARTSFHLKLDIPSFRPSSLAPLFIFYGLSLPFVDLTTPLPSSLLSLASSLLSSPFLIPCFLSCRSY